MTAIDEARAQLRSRPAKAEPEPWTFPSPKDFAERKYVLVFDATLSHCGWALIRSLPLTGLGVIARGCISPETGLSGYRETWEKMDQLGRMLEQADQYADAADAIVVESPAVHGHRTESSLIAGGIIRSRYKPGHLRSFSDVSPAHVSSVLLGTSKVLSAERKKAIRAAVIRLCPEAAGRGFNEHIRDAIATGATYLFDEKRRQP